MRYAAYGLLAAFLASGVYGVIPQEAKDWYTPSSGKFNTENAKGTIGCIDHESGTYVELDVLVDSDGNIKAADGGDLPLPDDLPEIFNVIYEAVRNTLKTETIARQNKERIETLGTNLYNLTSKKGFQITNPQTKQTYTVTIGTGTIAEGAAQSGDYIPGESSAADPTDNLSLGFRDDGKVQIAGWDDGNASTMYNIADVLTNAPAGNPDLKSFRLVARNPSKGLNYVDVGRLLEIPKPDPVAVDGGGITTNTADGALAQGVLSLYGWYTSDGVASLADFLTIDTDTAAAGDMPTYEVLARCTDGGDVENSTLEYLTLGNLYGVTWATNWTEAVEHITKEETIKIVNWTTNWVNYTENVTNYYDVVNWITNWVEHSFFVTNYEDVVNIITNMVYHENFITNMFYHENFLTNTWNHENFITNMFYHENFLTNIINHEDFVTNVIDVYSTISNFENFVTFQTNSYEKLHTIENWNYVTNYIVRFLGGYSGSGESEEETPFIDPVDDPYSEDYEPQAIDDYLLPVKNARMLVAITNAPFSRIDALSMLDFQSVDTNGLARAQICGFDGADGDTVPVKRRGADDADKIEWVAYNSAPADLLIVTTNKIEEITRWLRENNISNIFNVVVTNSDGLAAMRTNFFSQVSADTLLDRASVWTNDAGRVEINGFADADQGCHPVKADGTIEWRPDAVADADVMYDIIHEGGHDLDVRNRSLEASDQYGMGDLANVWSLYGFLGASNGQMPYKKMTSPGTGELAWRDPLDGDGATITNILGKLSIVGWETQPSNSVLYARWDEDEGTNHLEWVEWTPSSHCNCPKYCYIHEVEYNSLGFCPREGCPHSQFGLGVSVGGQSEDDPLDGI